MTVTGVTQKSSSAGTLLRNAYVIALDVHIGQFEHELFAICMERGLRTVRRASLEAVYSAEHFVSYRRVAKNSEQTFFRFVDVGRITSEPD